jgi:uncharacterized protein YdeI (YjbR/CyaY-like superfamily)
MAADALPELIVADHGAWRAWLDAQADGHAGVWLVVAKKGKTGVTTLSYAQALEEALCHGWIDGQVGRRDEHSYRQRFTPRRPRSVWSKNNVDAVERLLAEGRMRPAGLAAVEQAKTNGRWDAAYDGQARMEVPADLATALSAEPRAQANFERLTSQNRYAILYRIHDAKRQDTRWRRIEKFVTMLTRGETIHPQREALD